MEPLPERIGDFEILSELGAGGMGRVYLGKNPITRRLYAIKVVRDAKRDDGLLERLIREIRLADEVKDHRHVVQFVHAGLYQDDWPYLVYEYVDGVDLSQVVSQRGRLPYREACELGRQAALGLEALRQVDIVHRDIKPSNLFLAKSGILKIGDLGLSRAMSGEVSDQLTGMYDVLGTLPYMPPEMLDKSAEVSHYADQFSLGCTLFHLIGGNSPFPNTDIGSALKAHMEPQPPELPDDVDLPDDIRQVIRKSLQKTPSERYATPLAFSEALSPFAEMELRDSTVMNVVKVSSIATASATAPTEIKQPAKTPRKAIPFGPIFGIVLALSAAMAVSLPFFGSSGVRIAEEKPKSRLVDFTEESENNFTHLIDSERGFVKAVWHPTFGGDAEPRFRKRHQLRVQCDFGVLVFGTVTSRNFDVRLRLHQSRWGGEVGLVIGFLPPTEKEISTGKALDWQHFTIDAEKKYLARGAPKFTDPKKQPLLLNVLSHALPASPAGEVEIELQVRYGRLVFVSVMNQRKTTSVKEGDRLFNVSPAYLKQMPVLSRTSGAIGLLVRSADVTISEARIRTLP